MDTPPNQLPLGDAFMASFERNKQAADETAVVASPRSAREADEANQLDQYFGELYKLPLPTLAARERSLADEAEKEAVGVLLDRKAEEKFAELSQAEGYENSIRWLAEQRRLGEIDDDFIDAAFVIVKEKARQPIPGVSLQDAWETVKASPVILYDLYKGVKGLAKYAPKAVVEGIRSIPAFGGDKDRPTPAMDVMGASVLQGTAETVRLATRLKRALFSDVSDYSEENLKKRLDSDLKFYEFVRAVESGEAFPDLTPEDVEYIESIGELTEATNFVPFGFGFKSVKQAAKVAAATKLESKAVVKAAKTAQEAASVGTVRKAAGDVVESVGKGMEKVAESPTARALGAVTGATMSGGSPPVILMAALAATSDAAESVAKRPGKMVQGVGQSIKKPLKPGSPSSRLSEIMKDTGTAAFYGTVGMTPFASIAETPEERGTLLAGGGVFGAAGGGVAQVKNGVDSFGNSLWKPEEANDSVARAPVTNYGSSLDATHAAYVNTLPASTANRIEALRTLVGQPMFTLDPAEYDAIVKTDSQGVIDIVLEDGTKAILVRGGSSALAHESGHSIFRSLPTETQQSIIDAVFKAYGPEGVADMKALYESSGISLKDDAAAVEEIIADNFQVLFNGGPLGQLGTPKSVAAAIYSSLGSLAERVGIRDLRPGRQVQTSETLKFTPSYLVQEALRNAVEAMNLDGYKAALEGAGGATPAQPGGAPSPAQAPVTAPVPAGVTNVEPVLPPAQPKGFKKGDPLGVVKSPEGKLAFSGAKVWADAGGPTVRIEGVDANGNLVRADVPREWLESPLGVPDAGVDVGASVRVPTPLTKIETPAAAQAPQQAPAQVPVEPATPEEAAPQQAPVQAPQRRRNLRVTQEQQDEFTEPAPELVEANRAKLEEIANRPRSEQPFVEVDYLSAESEGTAPSADIRLEQRRLADAAEASTPDYENPMRELFQKIFAPFRYLGGEKPRVFGFSYDKLIQNLDIMAGWLSEHPDVQIPYESASDPQIRTDIITYLRNQSNGYGGGGEKLVRPPDTRPGTITPENPDYTPVTLPREKVEFIGTLMGLALPKKANARNLYFKRFAEMNGLVPKETASGAFDPNSFRQQLIDAGFDPALLNAVVENLPIRRIAGEVVERPDIKMTAGDTAFTEAAFMPAARNKDVWIHDGVKLSIAPNGAITAWSRPPDTRFETLVAVVDPSGNAFEIESPPTNLDKDNARRALTYLGLADYSQKLGGGLLRVKAFEAQKQPKGMFRPPSKKVGLAQMDAGNEARKREQAQRAEREAQKQRMSLSSPVYLGDVADDGTVRGKSVPRGPDRVVHESLGYDEDVTWRYNPRRQTVYWWSAPSAAQRESVLAWLERKGENPKFHRSDLSNPDTNFAALGFMPAEGASPGTGLSFKKFFSDVTKGTFGKSDEPFVPEIDLSDDLREAVAVKNSHSGNFDDHISKSIPTFYETQIATVKALSELPAGSKVLDIAASEGSWGKAITELSNGEVSTVSLDPNEDMAQFFKIKSVVPGAEYSTDAFLNGFTDGGVEVKAYDPTDRFDAIHESMGFQFIDPNRAAQVAEVKRLLKPDGIFLTEEKLKNDDWAANERLKDNEHKNKYFSAAELADKEKAVGFQQSKAEQKSVGMVDNMVSAEAYESVLLDNFKHVFQYWDSGNFKGYVASDSLATVSDFLEGLPPLKSKFSTIGTPLQVKRSSMFVNVGLNVPGGGRLTPEQVVETLEANGVQVKNYSVETSSTEPTVAATISPTDIATLDKVSRILNQEAIAAYNPKTKKGFLAGPNAEKWSPFNPDEFLYPQDQKPRFMPSETMESEGQRVFETVGREDALAFMPSALPERLYHGTSSKKLARGDTLYEPSPGMYGTVVYLTDSRADARSFGPNVVEVRAAVTSPAKLFDSIPENVRPAVLRLLPPEARSRVGTLDDVFVEASEDGINPSPTTEKIIQVLKDAGYDSLWANAREKRFADATDWVMPFSTESVWRADTGLQFMPAPPIDSPAFKRWFGDSKVVGLSGLPMVVHHGTAADFTVFDPSRSGQNFGVPEPGLFFTNFESEADAYARHAHHRATGERMGGRVISAYVSLQNPLVLVQDSDGRGAMSLVEDRKGLREEVAEALTSGEYDGVVAQATDLTQWKTGDPETVVIATRPEQIKLAEGNVGTFDPANPDIRFMPLEEAKLGEEQFSTRKKKGSLGGTQHLVHFSSIAAKTLNPKKMSGKGAATPTDLQGIPRAYFYRIGDSVYEAGIADRPYILGALVDGNAIYDLNSDPLGYIGMANREKADQMLVRAGFAGMRGKSGPIDMVAMFKPVKVVPLTKEDVYTPKQLRAQERKRGVLEDEDIDYQAQDAAWEIEREARWMPSFTNDYENYWLAPDGKLIQSEGDHELTARRILKDERDDGDLTSNSQKLYSRGYKRVVSSGDQIFVNGAVKSLGTLTKAQRDTLKQRAEGGQEVLDDSAQSFSPKVIYEAFKDGKAFMPAAPDTPEFKKWFGSSKVVNTDGSPLPVFHGTVSDFSKFERAKASPESDFGAGFYFTNTPEDVESNYAGEGPDLKNKIKRRAEQLMDESEDSSYDSDRMEEFRQRAREEMKQHEGATVPVWLRLENPFQIGGPEETLLEGKKFTNFIERLAKLADEHGGDGAKVREEMYSSFDPEGAIASVLIEKAGESEGLMYAEDGNGNLISKELIRQAIEGAGFDGIIDYTVDEKFGSQKRIGKPMAGMNPDTVHYIAFRPTQIKSAIGNRGTFSRRNPDIAFMPAEQRLPGFYSQLKKTLEAIPPKASRQQIEAALRDGVKEKGRLIERPVKLEELEDVKDQNGVSFSAWLKDNPEATRQDMVDFVDAGQVQVLETVSEAAQYYRYQEEGGESYRELVFTTPEKGPRFTVEDLVEDLDAVSPRDQTMFWVIRGPDNLYSIPRSRHPTLESAKEYIVATKQRPSKGYVSRHFDKVPNYLAHARVNERTVTPDVDALAEKARVAVNAKSVESLGSGAAGSAVRKGALSVDEARLLSKAKGWRNDFNPEGTQGVEVLFAEEIQSDLHQEGRKKGYKRTLTPAQDKRFGELTAVSAKRDFTDAEQTEWNSLRDPSGGAAVPDAPFKKSWPELVFKKLLNEAAVTGKDFLAWTTGEQQAERYDLSKQVSQVSIYPMEEGYERLGAFDLEGRVVLNERIPKGTAEKFIGKEAAKKLYAAPAIPFIDSLTGEATSSRELKDADLKVGAEGMKGFYDKILPSFADKYAKKWGVKTQDLTFPGTGASEYEARKNSFTAHALPITEAMRKDILENGQPLYMPSAGPAAPLADENVRTPRRPLAEDDRPVEEKEFTPEMAAAFMPAAPKVNLEDYIGRDVITITTDRLGIGEKEVGPRGAKRKLDREAQGGRGFPHLYTGLGWAFSSKEAASSFLTRLRATSEGDKALVATAVLGETNVLNSPFGQYAIAAAYRQAVNSGALKLKDVDKSIRLIFARAAKAAGGNPDMAKIKSLADYEAAAQRWPFTFGATKEIANRLDAAELKIPSEIRQALGLDARSIARDISDPELAGLPNFSLVSLMEIPVNQKAVKDDVHVSYPYSVTGKLIGFLRDPLKAEPLITTQRVRSKYGMQANPMMMVMPSIDALTPSETNPDPAQRLRDARLEYAR